jgi:hypothetical protein
MIDVLSDDQFIDALLYNFGLYSLTARAIRKKYNIPCSDLEVFQRIQDFPEIMEFIKTEWEQMVNLEICNKKPEFSFEKVVLKKRLRALEKRNKPCKFKIAKKPIYKTNSDGYYINFGHDAYKFK